MKKKKQFKCLPIDIICIFSFSFKKQTYELEMYKLRKQSIKRPST